MCLCTQQSISLSSSFSSLSLLDAFQSLFLWYSLNFRGRNVVFYLRKNIYQSLRLCTLPFPSLRSYSVAHCKRKRLWPQLMHMNIVIEKYAVSVLTTMRTASSLWPMTSSAMAFAQACRIRGKFFPLTWASHPIKTTVVAPIADLPLLQLRASFCLASQ